MSDPALEDALLSYLARDDSDEPKFQSLTTILELAPLNRWKRNFSSAERDIDDKDQVQAGLDQLVADAMAEKRWAAEDYEPYYRITQEGFYEATIGFDELIIQKPEEAPLPTAPIPIDSSAWTGRRLKENELAELATIIDESLERITGLQLPQQKLAQARSLLLAARALSEAPDPPINVISWLLAHFDRLVGISGLLVGVASLVSSWTQ